MIDHDLQSIRVGNHVDRHSLRRSLMPPNGISVNKFTLVVSRSGFNMNLIRAIIPLNSSLVRTVWDRQPFLTIFTPQLILEEFFVKILDFFTIFRIFQPINFYNDLLSTELYAYPINLIPEHQLKVF